MKLLLTKAAVCVAVLSAGLTSRAEAQAPLPVRALGPVVRVSTEPLASIATALPMPGGRVLVNDVVARRVLLLDSALAKVTVIADTTIVTGSAYGGIPGVLIHYRGDSALFIDRPSLSMLIIDGAGKISRVMAIPRPEDALYMWRPVGPPGFDAKGRFVYYKPGRNGDGSRGGGPATGRTEMPPGPADTAFIVGMDLATRALDTLASFKYPIPARLSAAARDDQGKISTLRYTPYPLGVRDAWVVCSDGAVAVVRGRDYHVDWLGVDGRWTSTPKMSFDWQRLGDEQKEVVIDSAVKAIRAQFDSSATGGEEPIGRPTLADIPDYRPPFDDHAVRPDDQGNLWIRTTTLIKGRPVYDVINRKGAIVDRVQLPPFREIVGFSGSFVYMAVIDGAKIAHLERARVR